MYMLETEIMISGGGIAGASTAYHLAQYGRHVTLLERNDIASEASGVNAGAIRAIGWGNVPNLESYLTMGSLEIFKSLQVELRYDIEFRRSGSLQAIQTEAEYAYIQRRVLELRSQGYTVDLLSTQETQMIEPALSPAFIPRAPESLHEKESRKATSVQLLFQTYAQARNYAKCHPGAVLPRGDDENQWLVSNSEY